MSQGLLILLADTAPLPDVDDMPWTAIVIGLLGGLALFLFGLEQMTGALKGVAGATLRRVLERFTRNRFMGAFTGMVITAVTQSSSVTTVLLVGFVSAGLMSLQQSVGVIMGANVGSTFTAQIIAFNLTEYALAIVTVGFVMMFGGRNERMRRHGAMVMGLGLIFFGMKLMSDAMTPLRDYGPFIDLMRSMDRIVLGVLAGAVFTALVQSSAATTGLVIILAAQGYVSLEAGIAIALGANIGTCATAMLATIGKQRPALRAAAVHVLFNVVGVMIWLPFIGQLADMVRVMSSEPARQIANAHTLFNVVNVVLMIGFTGPMAALVLWLIPARPTPMGRGTPVYLDRQLIPTPALALDRVRMELGRLARITLDTFKAAAPAVHRGGPDDLTRLARLDDAVDQLHEHIIAYLAELGRIRMTPTEERRLADHLSVAGYIENIGDAIETNLVEIGRSRIEHGVTISAATEQELQRLHRMVFDAVELLAQSLEEEDMDKARRVIGYKKPVRELAHAVIEHLGRRLIADEPNRLPTYRLEQEIVEQLRRVYYFARHAAWHVIGRPEDQSPDDPSA